MVGDPKIDGRIKSVPHRPYLAQSLSRQCFRPTSSNCHWRKHFNYLLPLRKEGLSWEARRYSSQNSHTVAPRHSAWVGAAAAGGGGGASPSSGDGRPGGGGARSKAGPAPWARGQAGMAQTAAAPGAGGLERPLATRVTVGRRASPSAYRWWGCRGAARRGSGWGARGTATQAGVPRSRPLLAMGWVWRWDAGRSGRGSFGKPRGGEAHQEPGRDAVCFLLPGRAGGCHLTPRGLAALTLNMLLAELKPRPVPAAPGSSKLVMRGPPDGLCPRSGWWLDSRALAHMGWG